MNIKTTLKTSVAAAALFAIAAPVAQPAQAADDTLKSGNKNSMTISGQVVRALWWADDGTTDNIFVSDGGVTNSRIRWIASGTLNENVTAGSLIEMDIPLSNAQGALTLGSAGAIGSLAGQTTTEGANSSNWGIRQQYMWVKHKKFGRLALGNTDSASNGRSEANLSGLSGVDDSGGTPYGDGIGFINSTTAGSETRSTRTVGGAFTNLDGRSRTDVLRYDTPSFMGFSLAASYIGGGDWDVGGQYSGKVGGFKILAKAQYNDSQASSATVEGAYSGSLAVLHDSGLNALVAGGTTIHDSDLTGDTTDKETNFSFWGIGYQAKIFGVGPTRMLFSWQHTNNQISGTAALGGHSSADSVGFSIGQFYTAIDASTVFSYRNYSFELNDDTNTFEDVDVVGLQTLFKF